MFKNFKSRVSRIKFALGFYYKAIKQAVYATKYSYNYLADDFMSGFHVGTAYDYLESCVMQEIDRVAKEKGIRIGVRFLAGEEAKQRRSALKGDPNVNEAIMMEAIIHESLQGPGSELDHIFVYPETIRKYWKYYDFQKTHSFKTVITQLVEHEMRHIDQMMALRKAGYDIKAVCERKRMNLLSCISDVLETDAYRIQLGEDITIEDFLNEYQKEYGAA